MSAGIVCPIDGTQLIQVSSTNLLGDPIYRWECPIDDWAGPWYSNLLSGVNEPLPELLRDVVFLANPITITLLPGIIPVDVVDDYEVLQTIHQNIVASVDTIFTFAQSVRLVRVTNWNTNTRVLVKDGIISSNSDPTAARVGKAGRIDNPSQAWFPFVTDTIHLRASLESEVTVEGYA